MYIKSGVKSLLAVIIIMNTTTAISADDNDTLSVEEILNNKLENEVRIKDTSQTDTLTMEDIRETINQIRGQSSNTSIPDIMAKRIKDNTSTDNTNLPETNDLESIQSNKSTSSIAYSDPEDLAEAVAELGYDKGLEYDVSELEHFKHSHIGDNKELMTNMKIFWAVMKLELGLNDEQAAAACGNIAQESSGNPRSPGGGLVQWQDGRWVNLEKYAKSIGRDKDDIVAQSLFTVHELTMSYKNVLEELRKATTVDAATEIWSSKYEVAGTPLLEKRKQYAQEFYDHWAGKNVSKKTDKGAVSTQQAS